jgi:hypothetical protein
LISGLFIAALVIASPYSLPYSLASSILGNDKALWDELGFAMNWAEMNSLAMNCPAINCPSVLKLVLGKFENSTSKNLVALEKQRNWIKIISDPNFIFLDTYA